MRLFEYQGKELFSRYGIPVPRSKLAGTWPGRSQPSGARAPGRDQGPGPGRWKGKGRRGGRRRTEGRGREGGRAAARAKVGRRADQGAARRGGHPSTRRRCTSRSRWTGGGGSSSPWHRGAGGRRWSPGQGGDDRGSRSRSKGLPTTRCLALGSKLGLEREDGHPNSARYCSSWRGSRERRSASSRRSTRWRSISDGSLRRARLQGRPRRQRPLPTPGVLPARLPRTLSRARRRKRGSRSCRLEGDVAVVGNGAGLVLSTLDLVADAGGRAACFLDLGGGAQRERVEAALRLGARPPEREGHPRQHIRRDNADDRRRGGAEGRPLRGADGAQSSRRISGADEEEAHELLAGSGITVFAHRAGGRRRRGRGAVPLEFPSP